MSKQDAVKKIMIRSLPSVLCIVLKRFCWTQSSRAKINTRVVFPLKDLDIREYCSDDVNEKDNTIYDLQSAVMHHGTGLQTGHYTAYCYNQEENIWEHFNDAQVSISNEEEVSNVEAYILFYQQRRTILY